MPALGTVPVADGASPPCVMVKPDSVVARVSLVLKYTAGFFLEPSIMVDEAPPELVSVMALPLKSMFS